MSERSTSAASPRLVAARAGAKVYTSSTACRACGSFERYVLSSGCAPCTRSKSKAAYAKVKEARQAAGHGG